MHLRAVEFVDVAEGARAESSSAHLAGCAACRARLADVRAAMQAAADADVPEPSPLFWDHLSRRVHDAVAANEAPRADRWRAVLARLSWRHAVVEPVAALAVLGMIVFGVTRAIGPAPHGAVSPGIDATASSGAGDPQSDAAMDPLLSLVASLAGTLDVDAANGLEAAIGADHAVADLTDGELHELQRLVEDELRQHSGD